MKKVLGLLFIASALSVSCERQDIQAPSRREAVQFSTSVGTKTSYQGTVTGNKEAILWNDGELFTVSCAQAVFSSEDKKTADYKVTAPEGVATAVNPNTADDEIQWGEGSHTFYAAYPAGKLDGSTLRGTIANTQNLTEKSDGVYPPLLSSNGYMVAAATASPSASKVNLAFKPMFTTLEFVVGPGSSTDVEISDITVKSNSVLAGTFSVAIAESDPQITLPTTDGANIISVKLGSGSVTVEKNKTITFSVVALPKDLTNIDVQFKVGSKTITLPLKNSAGDYITFAARKKSIIKALTVLGPEAENLGITTVITDQDVDQYEI